MKNQEVFEAAKLNKNQIVLQTIQVLQEGV